MNYCKHEPGKSCGLCGHDPAPRPVAPIDEPPGCTPWKAVEALIDNAVGQCRDDGAGVDARMALAAELTEIAANILVGELLAGHPEL